MLNMIPPGFFEDSSDLHKVRYRPHVDFAYDLHVISINLHIISIMTIFVVLYTSYFSTE